MPQSGDSSAKFRNKFREHWQAATDDNNLTLHGFRRFKTTHLLNLRFLEDEIAELDHKIYQAGLSLDLKVSLHDRLALRHCKRDAIVASVETTITEELVLKLRQLLKDYDEAISAFNAIMAMETFSLLDDEKQSKLRTDLSLPEIYNTRLLRVDLGPRSRTDTFQRWIQKYLRSFRYWRLSRTSEQNVEGLGSFVTRASRGTNDQPSYQNTALMSEVLSRIISSVTTGVFLVVPLAILSADLPREKQLTVVSLCILVFLFLVAIVLRVSHFEMMALTAAYAAVLSAFVSNGA